MAVLQTVTIVPAEGNDIILFPNWIKSLSKEEQEEFKNAVNRQEIIRQQFIDRGEMLIDREGYVWRAQSSDLVQKPNDPIWDFYWNRWLKETKQSIIDNRQGI